MYPIVNYVPMFMGLMQDPGRRTGFDDLYRDLMRVENLNLYVPPPKLWNCWPADELQYAIRHLATPHREFPVGYSYGGHAAVQYCWHALDEGKEIECLFLIDAVKRLKGARWSWLARSASLLSMKHKIPPNVKEVWYWRQNQTKPRGHLVVPAKGNSATKFVDRGMVPRPHVAMDNVASIHDAIKTRIINGLIMPS